MKEKVISSLGLFLKIVVIILLPIALFYYMDMQHATVTKEEDDDEGTRKLAIVNEDNGYVNGDEEIELGKEISAILAKRDRYSWTVENRSGAEKKFSEEKYDGILYISSNFSEHVMNFKAMSPVQANVHYVVQPNLAAKERQRVHREMSDVKHIVNKEMSTIYWSYVAQEIDHIQDQFDGILEKEIAFQEAIYSFYAPTSEKLANEIASYQERLSLLADQTGSIDDVVSENIYDATDAEKHMEQLLQAFSDYKELQEEQQQLFSELQRENKQKVDTGSSTFEKVLRKYASSLEKDMREYEHPEFRGWENMRKIKGLHDEIRSEAKTGKKELDDWEKGEHAQTYRQVVRLNEKFLQEYNYSLTRDTKDEVLEKIAALEDRHIDDYDPEWNHVFEAFDSAQVEEKLQELKHTAKALKEAAEYVRETEVNENKDDASNVESNEKTGEEVEERETENDTAHASQTNKAKESTTKRATLHEYIERLEKEIVEIERSLTELDDDNNGEDPEAIIEELKEIIEQLREQLEELEEEVYGPLIDRIIHLQQRVTYPRYERYLEEVFTEEEIEELLGAFLDEEELETKTAATLLDYVNVLNVFTQNLNTGSDVNRELVKDILDIERVKEELLNLYDVDREMIEKLQGIFERFLGTDEEEEGHLDAIERNFNELRYRTYRLLREYDRGIEKLFADMSDTITALEKEADHILQAMRLTEDDMFEWERQPNVAERERELVLQSHRSTLTSLDHLASLVNSLNEQQDRVIDDTRTLHVNIDQVQSESDDLNARWARNVLTTERVRDDVHDVLNNAMVDGQENFSVYDYLTNPVQLGEKAGGEVLSEREDPMPPVVLLLIILISGLLIGFITYYYAHVSYLVQTTLFTLLNLGVGVLIGYYGINLYSLPESRAIIWVIFTIVLLAATANLIRGGLIVHPFVGWLMSIALIIFYTTPLLDIVIPEFHFNNPISDVYIGMLYRNNVAYGMPLFILSLIIVVVSALVYTLQIYRNKKEVAEDVEEEAS